MPIIYTKDHSEMSKKAAEIIANEIKNHDKINICFATGSTPVETYQNLIKKYNSQEISFKNVTTFNLDEYVNLNPENHCSYHYFMDQNLFNHINVNRHNINFPNGIGNVAQNASDYEKVIKQKGGIDLMILGIGTNAHIAFNEPGSLKEGRTREVKLTQSTIKSNEQYFDHPSDIPKTAISMGIGTILEAKKIILLASGENKAQAIYDSIEGKMSEQVPASFLRMHPNVTFIVDEQASSLLKK
ncbi:glucosamine-6-phosphate deaminase [Mycoplasmopsis alligatoris]|uniref:Glucosamine-6-phosphate deaminase n=1 Tax=Mycoplasmopsis alligatoris A21JP2 TaxID=747682 RepID=D4XX48_9BACT|nr:glucosamine-6-phosphate deaminase [Mycoplasmopsis alligatoris]EFF41078.1 glucosamine-6-phosphate deaminase [Mycoplasmopsis alligatoris A21JP2]